ncbi:MULTISPECIES: TIGR04211 family SH3 domain-containing protein [unclassified Thalassolituus]|uniref:TIGR04211 family SH3 domain-containing protein n=1 Tax=unclassified Thalassolituus TaxID=2624967 RepID=UPI0025F04BC3|nr:MULTISPECIES: TIGR04211 family SH3 domain-containing protein [unclassified Thalassolituus]
MKKLFIVFALVLTSAAAQAVEKRYVTDTLWLQLRSGPSQEYRILKALQSGEHLIFISEDEATGYTKVKTDKGIEGWVLTRFLETEPVAKEKLILANRELEKLQAELETAQNQKAEFQAEVERLKSERSGLGRENSDLEQQLERITNISENALTLDEKVKKLTQRNQDLEIRLETLTAENESLSDHRQRTFLLYGGGLVVLGIIAGLILPSIRGRKNSGWS